MIPTLTQAKHREYTETFYQTLLCSPKFVTLIYLTEEDPDTATDSLNDFVGLNPVSEKKYVFQCLYDKNSIEYDESPVGFQKINDGVIFLSPLQLIPTLGTFRPDPKSVHFILDGKRYIVTKTSRKEELFDSCVAVQFTIKDQLRG